MPLPSSSQISSLDFPLNGSPYNSVPSKISIDTTTMDFALNAGPFVAPALTVSAINVPIEELINSVDEEVIYDFTPVDIEELVNALDETLVTVRVLIEELVNALDDPLVNEVPLPTILGMDFVLNASPFVEVNGNGGIFTETMNYALDAGPYVVESMAFTINVSIEELITATDSVFKTVIISDEELVDALDQEITNPTPIQELINALDETLVTVTLQIEELVQALDEELVHSFDPVPIEELIESLDTVFITVRVLIEELIQANESEIISAEGVPVDETSAILMQIGELSQYDDGMKIVVAEFNEADSLDIAGANIVIGEFNNVLVTNASDVNNPFEPTVAVNGTILIANPSTNPGLPALTNTSVYIQWLPAGITGSQWTDLYNFSFELGYNGGHFNIASKKPLKTVGFAISGIDFAQTYHWQYDQGAYRRVTPIDALANSNLGRIVEIFGFKGTILDFGPSISDSQASWTSAGFFGSPLLHINVNLLTYSSIMGYLISTNERLSNLGQNGISDIGGIDVQSAAKSIAEKANIQLQWYVQDAPLKNTFNLDGLTGISALSTLAGSVGATLRWNGNNRYYVAYPNQSIGLWEVPHAKLLTSAGINYQQHLDLETGATGQRLILFPRPVVIDPGSRTIPTAADQSSGLPTLQQITKIKQKVTADDPQLIFDLPYNYDRVYIQVLVPQNGNTSGSFTTKKPEEWFEFDNASLNVALGSTTSYIFTTYIGNTYVPQVRIDHNLFPVDGVNPSIDDGHFTMSLACSTKSLSGLYDKGKQNSDNNNRQAQDNGLVRYIRTYSGTITCQFFGSIPLPGMWGRAVIPGGAATYTLKNDNTYEESRVPLVGDLVVEGVIENVQVSFPGTVTIQVAQYAKIDFGQPKIDIGIGGFQ